MPTKTKNSRLVASILAVLVGMGVIAFFLVSGNDSGKPQPLDMPRNPEGSPVAFPTQQSAAVVIDAPKQGATVHSGDMVSGTALVQGDTVDIRLKSASRGMLLDAPVSLVGTPGQPRRFELPLDFQREAVPGDAASLEVIGTSLAGKPVRTVITVTVR